MAQVPSTGIASAMREKLVHNQVSPTQAGGTPFLKFDAKRTGEWLYGREGEPVTGDVFALDLESIQHGYIQWHKKKVNRKLVPITSPLPPAQEPILYEDNKGREQVDEAQEARSFEGTFDDGTRFVFETNSFGGRKAVDAILADLFTRAAEGSDYLWPHIKLDSNSYEHSEWGEVFEPVLTAVAWYNEAGESEVKGNHLAKPAAPKAAEEEAPKQPTRKRRAAPAEEEDDAGSEDASAPDDGDGQAEEAEQAPRRRRRRRPSA